MVYKNGKNLIFPTAESFNCLQFFNVLHFPTKVGSLFHCSPDSKL